MQVRPYVFKTQFGGNIPTDPSPTCTYKQSPSNSTGGPITLDVHEPGGLLGSGSVANPVIHEIDQLRDPHGVHRGTMTRSPSQETVRDPFQQHRLLFESFVPDCPTAKSVFQGSEVEYNEESDLALKPFSQPGA